MSYSGQPVWILLAVVVLVMAACGSPQQVDDPDYRALTQASTQQPVDAIDRAILQRLEQLEPGHEVDVEGAAVQAEAPYFAASGRTCRNVLIKGDGGDRARLACRLDDAWAFVPDVLGPMAGGQSP